MGGEEKQEPIDFESFKTEKNLPVGDFRDNLKQVTVICPQCRNANRQARRHCSFCEGTGMVTKYMTETELEGMMELNCDVWAEVDFGRGPVDVRCTNTGEHDEHNCQIIFTVDEADPDMN